MKSRISMVDYSGVTPSDCGPEEEEVHKESSDCGYIAEATLYDNPLASQRRLIGFDITSRDYEQDNDGLEAGEFGSDADSGFGISESSDYAICIPEKDSEPIELSMDVSATLQEEFGGDHERVSSNLDDEFEIYGQEGAKLGRFNARADNLARRKNLFTKQVFGDVVVTNPNRAGFMIEEANEVSELAGASNIETAPAQYEEPDWEFEGEL